MLNLIRATITFLGLLIVWQLAVCFFEFPKFILPSPLLTIQTGFEQGSLLIEHSLTTLAEIVLGLILGVATGLIFALQMLLFRPLQRWLLPVLIASQAIPVFALAPILMIWFGYGMTSKVVIAALIIFFPVTTTCFDGLRNTPVGFLQLAKTYQISPWAMLWRVRLPAALPTLASGIRIAVVIAPIGAVVGEWVGSEAGLGYLMMQFNARMQIDSMFAALFVLALFSVGLYYLTDTLLKRAIFWHTH